MRFFPGSRTAWIGAVSLVGVILGGVTFGVACRGLAQTATPIPEPAPATDPVQELEGGEPLPAEALSSPSPDQETEAEEERIIEESSQEQPLDQRSLPAEPLRLPSGGIDLPGQPPPGSQTPEQETPNQIELRL